MQAFCNTGKFFVTFSYRTDCLNLLARLHLGFMVNQKFTSQEFLYLLLLHTEAPNYTSFTNKKLMFLEAYVKDENNHSKNSTTFFNYVRNVPNKDGEIILLFDVTSL